ncbi:hypothetical protein SNE26_07290 [Mucilaginibacter sp. cycad4]|uniref:hypothetical protein n=1 Tax=Mucilaginibacter sp. cycad4 TaxID=3342096 RepID=UPI002AAB2BB1|nr:hypothetical protein [Mucilaginibacter gossypii]WPV01576.1 hypothetical protein SNE26_07290 [Mucilaginibacter gossypii]
MDKIINFDNNRFTTIVLQKNGTHALQHQFENREEFCCQLIDLEAESYHFEVLNSIKQILKDPVQCEKDFLILCLNDHEFSEDYNAITFDESIKRAEALEADVLVPGLSYFCCSIPINENLSWVESIESAQFIVIFKRFYQTLRASLTIPNEYIQSRISRLSQNKIVLTPFFSINKNINSNGQIENNDSSDNNKNSSVLRKLKLSDTIYQYYGNLQNLVESTNSTPPDDEFSIPTYVINLPERDDRRSHIIKQFQDRSEFDFKIIEAHRHSIGAIGLWITIRKIIKLAIENDDDVIIICEDDHEFTDDYAKHELLKNIFEGFQQNIDYINGGTSSINVVVPVSRTRFWVDLTRATQFMIIYKRLFEKILSYEFSKDVVADIVLSNLAENKMILFPFISKQHNFGYSDVTPQHKMDTDLVDIMFSNTERRLSQIKNAFEKYNSLEQKSIF